MRTAYCSPEFFFLVEILWQTQLEFAGNTRVTKADTLSQPESGSDCAIKPCETSVVRERGNKSASS